MEIGEKYRRCQSARRVLGGAGVGKVIMCKVYGRTVSDCRDCAFSILQRPAYIERIAEQRLLSAKDKST